MSSASIQKLFCGIYSAFKFSFDEFVQEKVVSLSYSSAILGPPPSAFSKTSLNIRNFTDHVLMKPGLEDFEHYFTSV